MVRRVILAALVGVLVATFGSAAAAEARTRPAPCRGPAGTTVAKHGGQSLFVAYTGEDDGLYGAPQAVFACRHAKAKPVRISEWEAGTSITIRKVRWTRYYVAYAQFGSDNQCTKYSGRGASECSYSTGGSYDLRTGKRKATYDPTADVASTRLSPRGWLGVIGKPDADGNRTIFGADGGGLRTLGTGLIDPDSVRFDGAHLLWTQDGVEQLAPLGPDA
ncbi:MAG: hypothetical protein WC558_04190 [Patulibacter sp.]